MDISRAFQKIVRTPRDTGFYETLVYLIYRDWVAKPGSVAIDIGAHAGLHTFRLADCVGERGRVFAFEPLPELAEKIKAEAAERYKDDRVEVHAVALSDEVGATTFYRHSDALSQSSLVPGHGYSGGGVEGFSVEVSTLDVFFGDLNRYITVLKIDAEGAEYRILNGARKLLARSHPLVMLEFVASQMHLLGKTADDFFNLADELDYVFFNLDGTEYSREFVASGQRFPCYEIMGAKRGHWIENFLRNKMRLIVERYITTFSTSRKIDLGDALEAPAAPVIEAAPEQKAPAKPKRLRAGKKAPSPT